MKRSTKISFKPIEPAIEPATNELISEYQKCKTKFENLAKSINDSIKNSKLLELAKRLKAIENLQKVDIILLGQQHAFIQYYVNELKELNLDVTEKENDLKIKEKQLNDINTTINKTLIVIRNIMRNEPKPLGKLKRSTFTKNLSELVKKDNSEYKASSSDDGSSSDSDTSQSIDPKINTLTIQNLINQITNWLSKTYGSIELSDIEKLATQEIIKFCREFNQEFDQNIKNKRPLSLPKKIKKKNIITSLMQEILGNLKPFEFYLNGNIDENLNQLQYNENLIFEILKLNNHSDLNLNFLLKVLVLNQTYDFLALKYINEDIDNNCDSTNIIKIKSNMLLKQHAEIESILNEIDNNQYKISDEILPLIPEIKNFQVTMKKFSDELKNAQQDEIKTKPNKIESENHQLRINFKQTQLSAAIYESLNKESNILIQNLKNQLNNLKKQIKDKNRSINDLKTENSKLQEQYNIVTKEKSELQEQYNVIIKEKSELQEQYNVIIKEKSELQEQYNQIIKEKEKIDSSSKVQKSKTHTRIRSLEVDTTKLKQQIKEQSKKIEELKSNLTAKYQETSDLKQKNSILLDAKNNAQQDAEKSRVKIGLSRSRNVALKSKLQELQNTIEKQQQLMKGLNDEIERRGAVINNQREGLKKLEKYKRHFNEESNLTKELEHKKNNLETQLLAIIQEKFEHLKIIESLKQQINNTHKMEIYDSDGLEAIFKIESLNENARKQVHQQIDEDIKQHTVSNLSLPIEPVVANVLRTLEEGGYHALLVGGPVRDRLLNIAPNDEDIVTTLDRETFKKRFPHAYEIPKAPGIFKLSVSSEDHKVFQFDISVATDLNLKQDALRRDLTINSFHGKLISGTDLIQVIDSLKCYYPNLNKAPLSLINNESGERFTNDGVRILRFLRIGFRLGLLFNPTDKRNLSLYKESLKSVPFGKLYSNMRYLFKKGFAEEMLTTLITEDLYSQLCPINGEAKHLIQPYEKLFAFWIKQVQMLDAEKHPSVNFNNSADVYAFLMMLPYFQLSNTCQVNDKNKVFSILFKKFFIPFKNNISKEEQDKFINNVTYKLNGLLIKFDTWNPTNQENHFIYNNILLQGSQQRSLQHLPIHSPNRSVTPYYQQQRTSPTAGYYNRSATPSPHAFSQRSNAPKGGYVFNNQRYNN